MTFSSLPHSVSLVSSPYKPSSQFHQKNLSAPFSGLSAFGRNHRIRSLCSMEARVMNDSMTYLTQREAAEIDETLMGPLGFSVDQLMELAGLSVATSIAVYTTDPKHDCLDIFTFRGGSCTIPGSPRQGFEPENAEISNARRNQCSKTTLGIMLSMELDKVVQDEDEDSARDRNVEKKENVYRVVSLLSYSKRDMDALVDVGVVPALVDAVNNESEDVSDCASEALVYLYEDMDHQDQVVEAIDVSKLQGMRDRVTEIREADKVRDRSLRRMRRFIRDPDFV